MKLVSSPTNGNHFSSCDQLLMAENISPLVLSSVHMNFNCY